jgi:hypothetical protein
MCNRARILVFLDLSGRKVKAKMTKEPNRLPVQFLSPERPVLGRVNGRAREHWMPTDKPSAPNLSIVIHKDVHGDISLNSGIAT